MLKKFETADHYEWVLSAFWRHKQETADGTPLPDGFPAKELLEAAQYEALEDIDGADVAELRLRANLQPSTAQAVIAAATAALE